MSTRTRMKTHLVPCLLVGTEHVTDLSTTGTDISSRDIGVVTNVSGQLLHESVTLRISRCRCANGTTYESPDLIVGLALGVKVGTTLSTTHVQASQGVLEDLLETEAFISDAVESEDSQLQDGKVDGGVQSKTTLVRTESRVELDSETSVDSNGSVIPLPGNSEVDDSLGNLDDLQSTSVLGVLLEERLKGRGDLVDRL
jgi:hypothetical protein